MCSVVCNTGRNPSHPLGPRLAPFQARKVSATCMMPDSATNRNPTFCKFGEILGSTEYHAVCLASDMIGLSFNIKEGRAEEDVAPTARRTDQCVHAGPKTSSWPHPSH